MPTKIVTAKWINSGVSEKTKKAYWGIKTPEGEVFWSKTGNPHTVDQGAVVEVTYDVSKSGSNNIISIHPAGNGKAVRAKMDPGDALGAFRTTAFNAFVSAGMVALDAAAIRDALRKIEAGYTQATAAPSTQTGRDAPDYKDALDDDIPY